MSPDNYDGDLADYVKTILVQFASTLGMGPNDDRLGALSQQLHSALEGRRFRQKLASIAFSQSELEAFFNDARRIQTIAAQMRRSPILSWLQSRSGVVAAQDDSIDRMLQLVVQYVQEHHKFESKHPYAICAHDLNNGIDTKGNNLLILKDLPCIYAQFINKDSLKGQFEDYKFPDIVGQFNPTSSFIAFMVEALDVLSISNNGDEWTPESLVQRIKRARDGRRKNRQ